MTKSLGQTYWLASRITRQLLANPKFKPKALPVTMDYLRSQGLGEAFIQYMAGWEGFVASS